MTLSTITTILPAFILGIALTLIRYFCNRAHNALRTNRSLHIRINAYRDAIYLCQGW